MRIAFFAPHKPVDHKVPSGDLMIGRGLRDFLTQRGHKVKIASSTRLWNISERPKDWLGLYLEYRKILKRMQEFRPDIWLTYHSYHKSPDIFGPRIKEKLNIPYAIYQGVFATKHRRRFKTWPGYMANRRALLYADHVFANKEIDFHNLSRIILPGKLSRTYPGIKSADFPFCPRSRAEIRNMLGLENNTIIMSTAMLREDVKAQSISDLIEAFSDTIKTEPDSRLVIAGDGEARERLEWLAKEKAGNKIHFLGKIPRHELYRYYSAADLFAFPGINESLGMVYLEAQSASLPVVAYSTRGPSEAVEHGRTGLLSTEGDINMLSKNMQVFIGNTKLREQMGLNAPARINDIFNMDKNLLEVEETLLKLVQRK